MNAVRSADQLASWVERQDRVSIAALYDIRGNLPALEAVLEEVRTLKVDQLVIGGDVLPGPMPCATLALLLESDIPVRFIHGNGELAVLARED